jgi:hypothetical protein
MVYASHQLSSPSLLPIAAVADSSHSLVVFPVWFYRLERTAQGQSAIAIHLFIQ